MVLLLCCRVCCSVALHKVLFARFLLAALRRSVLFLRLWRWWHGLDGEDADWEVLGELVILECSEDVVVHGFSPTCDDLVRVAWRAPEVSAHLLLPLC